jgi:Holliday junction resolvase RusA-like endonuclease
MRPRRGTKLPPRRQPDADDDDRSPYAPGERSEGPTRFGVTFDFTTASPDEIRDEAARRVAISQPKAARIAMTPLVPVTHTLTAVTVVIPFPLLVSDNLRMIPIIMRKGKATYPLLVANAKYKKAKIAIATVVRAQLPKPWGIYTGRCTLDAVIHEPNASRTRDLTNWAKIVSDALSGLLYVDDGQLDRSTWIRGAVDPVHPRLVLTVSVAQ